MRIKISYEEFYKGKTKILRTSLHTSCNSIQAEHCLIIKEELREVARRNLKLGKENDEVPLHQ